uniref:Cyclopropane-fatty-acyl-phospholipid synthase n=1 Tax=Picea sitchensis TaxID=3332 RepID=A9P201_PICSI|nr:unknown [Picea sitchensis]
MMETQQPGGIMNTAYNVSVRVFLRWLEANLVPDYIIRKLTRTLLAKRLRLGYNLSACLQLADFMAFINALKQMPIAMNSEAAKAQHYELLTSFFKPVLGKHLKYSCAYFTRSTSTLNEAEEAMLELYCERAKVEDGQTVLDIGCGWGSLTLYIARKYPNNQVTGICNSTTQKVFIEEQCRYVNLRTLLSIK